MRINAEFSKRVSFHYAQTPWVKSPAVGVERKMLDRIGDEVARATTIVRFAPGSRFDEHTHDGGEEFLVLKGVFQDETGDFPVGTYVRNPPTTHHAPSAAQGATILVKLHQFDPADREEVRKDTSNQQTPHLRLFLAKDEDVRIEVWQRDNPVQLDNPSGLEIFVLEGGFRQDGEDFNSWDWLRLPPGMAFQGCCGPDGARVWIKTGHLNGLL